MASTTNCVVCLEKATCWSGHVHLGESTIIAGFCRAHFKNHPLKEGCKGCFGEWTEGMGVDKSFGQLMYIDRDGLHPVEE